MYELPRMTSVISNDHREHMINTDACAPFTLTDITGCLQHKSSYDVTTTLGKISLECSRD